MSEVLTITYGWIFDFFVNFDPSPSLPTCRFGFWSWFSWWYVLSSLFKSNLLLLPVVPSIRYFWGVGSTLGVRFSLQIIRGLLLALAYVADSVYGRGFFLATGFHGGHVLAGSIFLLVGLMRLKMGAISSRSHFGLEAAIWY